MPSPPETPELIAAGTRRMTGNRGPHGVSAAASATDRPGTLGGPARRSATKPGGVRSRLASSMLTGEPYVHRLELLRYTRFSQRKMQAPQGFNLRRSHGGSEDCRLRASANFGGCTLIAKIAGSASVQSSVSCNLLQRHWPTPQLAVRVVVEETLVRVRWNASALRFAKAVSAPSPGIAGT